jgi:hypothetical protein
MNYITEDIQTYLNGEGKYDGKPLLITNNNFAVTTGQIYARLCQEETLAFSIGKGLVTLGTDRQWRPLSYKEWEEACLRLFAFARLQEPVGAGPRALIILEQPPKLFLLTCKQSRWNQYQDLFPRVDVPEQTAFINRP